jgi:hypothetical protein
LIDRRVEGSEARILILGNRVALVTLSKVEAPFSQAESGDLLGDFLLDRQTELAPSVLDVDAFVGECEMSFETAVDVDPVRELGDPSWRRAFGDDRRARGSEIA